jgi:DNA-binding PadR family transcriptional regulator
MVVTTLAASSSCLCVFITKNVISVLKHKIYIEKSSRINFTGDHLESAILEKMQRKVVKTFLDMLILLELRNGSLSDHDVVSFINKRFNVSMSTGTIHSCLSYLRREGLIMEDVAHKRKVYRLTEEGKQTAEALLRMKEKILGLVVNLFISK